MRITLTRAEGPIEACGVTKTVETFQDANEILKRWSWTAPDLGGYDKCDFSIENEETGVVFYKGRYDLTHWRVRFPDLKAHVLGYLSHIASDECTMLGAASKQQARELHDLLEGAA